jgi:hypothetical protein
MRIATVKDLIPAVFTMDTSDSFEERMSSIGELGDWSPWEGTLAYTRWYEQYNVVVTHRQFSQGMRFERTAMEDDLTGILRGDKYAKLVDSGIRTRQKHAAALWNGATSNDMTFYVRSEAVPLASDSHTTRTPGVSTASGFDNLILSALSPVSYRAARIQMARFANDQGDITYTQGDTLVVPIDLRPRAEEILFSTHQVDTANNNINPEARTAKILEQIYWTDVNNWALVNEAMMKENCHWYDRRKPDFRTLMDFDTEQLKCGGSGRWSYGIMDWRFLLFGSVS